MRSLINFYAMKTRKQIACEMIEELEQGLIKLSLLKDYRQFIFENDEELKGNMEAKKELNANIMQIEHSEKMIAWLNKELLRCE